MDGDAMAGEHVATALLDPRDRGGTVPLRPLSADVIVSVVGPVADRAAVVAESFRVLRPGGRLRISDEPGDGAAAGPLTSARYRELLLRSGFVGSDITVTAERPRHSVLVQATKPPITAGLEIRPMRAADAGQVLAIYQAGLDDDHASFETVAPTWDRFDAGRLRHLRYVAVDSLTGVVGGWIAAAPVSARAVYAGVVEHSVYVHPGHKGQGIGRALLTALIAGCEDAGVWTIQAGIFPENTASRTLHRALGFRVVGTRRRVGRHRGRWRDMLLLERRSEML
ncbi:GNAT family N-acetyltransferase [Spirillospora sp. CA-255316]